MHFGDWPFIDWLYQPLMLIYTFFIRITMLLIKLEPFKWIRRKYSETIEVLSNNNNNNNNENSNTKNNNNTFGCNRYDDDDISTNFEQCGNNESASVRKGKISKGNVNSPLNEVLVGSDGSTIAISTDSNWRNNNNNKTIDNDMDSGIRKHPEVNRSAPIAQIEGEEEMDEYEETASEAQENDVNDDREGDAEWAGKSMKMTVPKNKLKPHDVAAIEWSDNSTVRRNKSRVHYYLKRFQERFASHSSGYPLQPVLEDIQSRGSPKTDRTTLERSTMAAEQQNEERLNVVASSLPSPSSSPSTILDTIMVVKDGIDYHNYENIELNLCAILDDAPKEEKEKEDLVLNDGEYSKTQAPLANIEDIYEIGSLPRDPSDSSIDDLVDGYLSNIYPLYLERTRTVLIREACDLLVSGYDGSLKAFESSFLIHFARIAAELKQKHAIGESLIWCQGWPLATPTGKVILHLGSLDTNLVKPADLYLCVKAVDTSSNPRLHAIWRSSGNPSSDVITIHSRCIDLSDPGLYLSILNLEMMLNDELQQLLQNLLVGVEQAIERVSVSELAFPNSRRQQLTTPPSLISNTPNCTNNNNTNTESLRSTNADGKNLTNIRSTLCATSTQSSSLPFSSPKCGLKRSELITKNKLLNNKFMLRRLTNRQDSMTSTSSDNSFSSISSTSSDELFGQGCVPATDYLGRQSSSQAATNSSTSPALPLFCLGNSFPHIDSDEENSDERRNSLGSDVALMPEIIPPRTVNELPEKLLTSGIYLPGSRDLKGRPLITIDAECVVNAGLNCYEVATVLLYYTTIPERNNNFHNISNQQKCQQPWQNQQQQQLSTQMPQTQLPHLSSQSQSPPQLSSQSPSSSPSHNQQVGVTNKISQQLAQQIFTILIIVETASHLNVIDLICQSLKLFTNHYEFCEILAICTDHAVLATAADKAKASATTTASVTAATVAKTSTSNGTTTTTTTQASGETEKVEFDLPMQQQQQHHQQQQQQTRRSSYSVKFISVDEVTTSVAPSQIPRAKLHGLHHHEPRKWLEFFALLEPFQRQCVSTGQRLVTAMNEIRCADIQGLPTRRQLYAQHRALSRALMDSELHNVRKLGAQTLTRLQELAKTINSCGSGSNGGSQNAMNKNQSHGFSYSGRGRNNNNNRTNNNNNNNNSSIFNFVNSNRSSSSLSPLPPSSLASSSSSPSSSSSSSSPSSSFSAASVAMASPPAVTTPNSVPTAVATTTTVANANTNNNNNQNNMNSSNIDVAIKLNKVTLLFNEVDRAAKRLEQLTEQRRERLRELTRQRALEDEINEVTSWMTSDGNENLQRFSNLQLDCERTFKENEHEFENYYFISMKHLAKGRDLYEAASDINALQESASNLKLALDCFSEKLELARDRIEGAARLHQLLSLNSSQMNEETRVEMQRLAEKVGVTELLDKHIRDATTNGTNAVNATVTDFNGKMATDSGRRIKPNSLSLHNLNFSCTSSGTGTNGNTMSGNAIKASTPLILTNPMTNIGINGTATGTGSNCGSGDVGRTTCQCWRESRHVEDVDVMLDVDAEDVADKEVEEEEQSKIADSGLGGCDRCEENSKLSRICSCQSLNEAGHLFDKNDELDDECFERPSKRFLNINSPMEANMHLQSPAFNLDLPKGEELSFLDPKIQKTLLLIMHEMIGTERDYVRSLYYVIENYVDELLRDDITQPLRGQRYVIFGNIEKIFEFHNSHFLNELERYASNPLKVGAAFLEMESKFYLYALYNKNKPKSDTLMSEYGTAFFKSKQLELNDKMDLASYLLKPVQRMGKYALLLQQLVKACSSVQGAASQEIAADVEELQRAEEMVKFQLRHGNDLLAMDSLRDCDVNVKEQGRLMRQNEFLVWQGRGGKKTLRQVFLFEELVLFSKARRFPDRKNLDIYIYKNSIKTSDIGLTAHVGDSPTKFEIWFRKRKPEDTWTLQCMSEDIKNAWTEEISKLLWKQAKRNRDIRLAEMSSMGIGSKPCLDIRPSNNQINDRSITFSQLGKAPKLRHSFVGLHSDGGKSSTRPISLISESSISSGTSSSSTSTGTSTTSSSFGSGKHQRGLELINETQTLTLASKSGSASDEANCNNNNNTGNGSNNNVTNTAIMNASSATACVKSRNQKRSTTLVSQLSMESGILSDISMTPDQEHIPEATATWSSAGGMRKKNHHQHNHHHHHYHTSTLTKGTEKHTQTNSENFVNNENRLGAEELDVIP